MRKQLDKKLAQLNEGLAQMAAGVQVALENSVASFVEGDNAKARKVMAGDEQLNLAEMALEKKAAQLIALQQPVADDLRGVITILKASSEFERMGDHTVSIAKAALHTSSEQPPQAKELQAIILNMKKRLIKMLDQVVSAYQNVDSQQAYAIAEDDSKINELYETMRNMTLLILKQDPGAAPEVIDYRSVGRHLERIGDYITNVAEWVVYLAEGKITELAKD